MSEDAKVILIVDDNNSTLKTLSDELERVGYKVLTAQDGAWGLDVALRERPDLILLDIMMPNIDGVSMLKQLRQHEWGEKVAVIILTNLIFLEDMPDVQKLATEYLLKSDVSLEDIVRKVKQCFYPSH